MKGANNLCDLTEKKEHRLVEGINAVENQIADMNSA
jgi:hypothetical protein